MSVLNTDVFSFLFSFSIQARVGEYGADLELFHRSHLEGRREIVPVRLGQRRRPTHDHNRHVPHELTARRRIQTARPVPRAARQNSRAAVHLENGLQHRHPQKHRVRGNEQPLLVVQPDHTDL